MPRSAIDHPSTQLSSNPDVYAGDARTEVSGEVITVFLLLAEGSTGDAGAPPTVFLKRPWIEQAAGERRYLSRLRAVVVYEAVSSRATSACVSIRFLIHSTWVASATLSSRSIARSTVFSYVSTYMWPALRAASMNCSLKSLNWPKALSRVGAPFFDSVAVGICAPWVWSWFGCVC